MEIAYISAWTGLGAVIVSPLVAYATIYRQARVSILSTSRQKWIDDLRVAISEYSGLMNSLNQARSLGHQTYDDIYPKLQKSFELESRILLQLNPTEEKHKKLTDLMVKGRGAVFGPVDQYHHETWNNAWYEMIRVSSAILKEEWERVKKLR